jgi:hypothetical protein
MRLKRRLVWGVGINDVDYAVNQLKTTGFVCPYYLVWQKMLERCYSEKYLKVKPTYVGCSIHPEWQRFSNFIKWVDSQPNRDWQNCQPDKDLLVRDNKLYGPDTVVFVSRQLNGFLNTNKGQRGTLLIGVSYYPNTTLKFRAACNDPFLKKQIKLGFYKTELDAHKAWQAKKHEYACQLAELQDDPRVADALRQRYAPDKDWTKE